MIIFVGDKPSAKMKPNAPAFQGAVCEGRLLEWISRLTKPNELVILVNRTETRRLAALLNIKRNNPSINIVALGNEAANTLTSVPHFKLPHPSGRNRKLNSKKYVDEQLAACKTWLQEDK